MNNTKFITKNEVKLIVCDQTQKLIFSLNQTFPKELENEKLDLIAIIESLERRICKEINNNNEFIYIDHLN